MIVRIVKLTIAPGNEALFEALFKETAVHIRRFPGCLDVQLLKSAAGVYFTLSRWRSEAALESYRASPLFQKTWPRVKALMAGRAEAWTTYPVWE